MSIKSETVERNISEYSLSEADSSEFWGHFDHRSSYGARVEQLITFDRELEYVHAWVTEPEPKSEEVMYHVLSVQSSGKKARVMFQILQKSEWFKHERYAYWSKPMDYRVVLSGKFKSA